MSRRRTSSSSSRSGASRPGHGDERRPQRYLFACVRRNDRRMRQGPDADERYENDPEQRPEPDLHPGYPHQLRQEPTLSVDIRPPLAQRHRQQRRHGRIRRSRLGLLRAEATVEQQHDLRRPPGPQQRLGQHQWSGRHPRRQHPEPGPGRSVHRHDPGLRDGLELRRCHELRARVRPAGGLPGGRGLLRSAAQRVQRRHPARRLLRHPRHPRQRAQHLQRTVAAGHVRPEQRLHGAEPAGADAGQPDPHHHRLLRLPGRVPGPVGRVRR